MQRKGWKRSLCGPTGQGVHSQNGLYDLVGQEWHLLQFWLPQKSVSSSQLLQRKLHHILSAVHLHMNPFNLGMLHSIYFYAEFVQWYLFLKYLFHTRYCCIVCKGHPSLYQQVKVLGNIDYRGKLHPDQWWLAASKIKKLCHPVSGSLGKIRYRESNRRRTKETAHGNTKIIVLNQVCFISLFVPHLKLTMFLENKEIMWT